MIIFIADIPMYGASPSANSIHVIPIDQISAEKSYPFYKNENMKITYCSITSGAIQQGDLKPSLILGN